MTAGNYTPIRVRQWSPRSRCFRPPAAPLPTHSSTAWSDHQAALGPGDQSAHPVLVCACTSKFDIVLEHSVFTCASQNPKALPNGDPDMIYAVNGTGGQEAIGIGTCLETADYV